MVFDILIFIFLDRKQEDRRFWTGQVFPEFILLLFFVFATSIRSVFPRCWNRAAFLTDCYLSLRSDFVLHFVDKT